MVEIDLAGHTAFVTGASRGIGAALARVSAPGSIVGRGGDREECKNPDAAGQAVWVDARHWGSVEMTARDKFEGGIIFRGDRGLT